MITRKRKEELLAELKETFSQASSYFLVDFKGMNVEETIAFRRELKSKGIKYKVAKNTLIARALSELGKEALPADKLKGETAIAFAYDDPVAPSKIIKQSFEKNNKPVLKAAVIEGQFYDGSRLKELASLPSKADIMASILGSLNSPISGIVGSLNAVMGGLASVIEEVAKKRHSAA